jgi:aminopeptidase
MNMVFTKRQLENYAETLIWGLGAERQRPLKRGDVIILRVQFDAMPLAEVVHRKLVELGLNVVFRYLPNPAIEKDFYQLSDKAQRTFVNAGEKEFYESNHGLIALNSPASLTHLKDVDPKRIAEVAIAKRPLRKIWDRLEEKGQFSWTLCTYPTEELARRARLSMKEYTAQIVKACYLDEKDPVARWKRTYKDCMSVKKWLKGLRIETFRVQTKNMDIEIKLGERRRFKGVSGANIPSFEVYTSPDWRGTRGTYYANLPSFRSGNIVQGIRLTFKDGRAVKVRAAQGEDFVKKTLATDKGACQLGEFSLTDIRFSKIDKFMADTLFDENFGGRHGNCHVALGVSYSDTFDGDPGRLTEAAKKTLGFNDSSIHWDIINTEDKLVTAECRGGRTVVVYENGKFKY